MSVAPMKVALIRGWDNKGSLSCIEGLPGVYLVGGRGGCLAAMLPMHCFRQNTGGG